MQTRVSVDKEDSGKSIRLNVGDVLDVSLPETSAQAAWRVDVDADVLAPVTSPTNTQSVWVLDEVEQTYMRSFRAAQVGHAVLSMSYVTVADGNPLGKFALEVTVGDAPRPKPIRQALPTPQLVIILGEFMLVAIAGALLSFRLATVVAGHTPGATADLLIALLGTVGMGTLAGYLLVRIVSLFAGRLR